MSCSHLFQTYSIPLVILIMQLWKSTTLVASNEPQRVAQLCPTLCNPMDCPWNSLAQNIGVGSLSLPFPTQGLNPGHPHCRQILYQLSHKRSPRTWEWVAYPFSRGSSQPRNWNRGLQHCRQILYQLSYQGSPSMNHMHSLVMLLCSLF